HVVWQHATGTLTVANSGPQVLTFLAKDRAGNITTKTVNITVSIGGGVFALDPIGNKTVSVGSELSFKANAVAAAGKTVTYNAAPLPLPAGASFVASTGQFTWRPDQTQGGSYNVTFSASDGTSNSSETITITVNGPVANAPTSFAGRVIDTNSYTN